VSEVETLSHKESVLNFCPVLVYTGKSPEFGPEHEACNQELRVIVTNEIVGDDYGSWETVYTSFECGHTLQDMQQSIQHRDEV
jgi:hypothetical protein